MATDPEHAAAAQGPVTSTRRRRIAPRRSRLFISPATSFVPYAVAPTAGVIVQSSRRQARRREAERRRPSRGSAVSAVPLHRWFTEARGLHRIFNAAEYRFWWNSSREPVEEDAHDDENATLPYSPSTTFGVGTHRFACAYFNGVLLSGFRQMGRAGERSRRIDIAAGPVQTNTPPCVPEFALQVLAGGVIRVHGRYLQSGTNRATVWAIAYAAHPSLPPADSPTATKAFVSASGLEVLVYDLPAQIHGTVMNVRVQVSRDDGAGAIYSESSSVRSATASTGGPAAASMRII